MLKRFYDKRMSDMFLGSKVSFIINNFEALNTALEQEEKLKDKADAEQSEEETKE